MCVARRAMGTRKATISVPSDPRNLFAKKREIATPLPPFYVRGIIGSENHHPPFPAIMDKAVRVRFWRVYTHVYMYTVIVCREIIIRHFFPSSTPPSVPQSRSLCRTRVRAGLAACGSHFGARSPGVERYRSVPDRKATGFSLRLIRSFSWFRLFTLLVLLVISLPAINVVRGTSTRINRDSRAESLECIYKFGVDSNGRNSSKIKYR